MSQGLLSNELMSENSLFGSAGGSNIKKIQTGMFSFSHGTINNIPISPVDMAKTIVYYTMSTSLNNSSSGDTTDVQIKLTSTTNLMFTRGHADTGDFPIISWTVIEFNNVKSLQTGITNSVGVTTSISIAPVNPSKTLAFATHFYGGNSGIDSSVLLTNVFLYNSTTLDITMNNNYPYFVLNQYFPPFAWQVIEFN